MDTDNKILKEYYTKAKRKRSAKTKPQKVIENGGYGKY